MPPSKSALREHFITARAALSPSVYAARSVACCRQIHAHIEKLAVLRPIVAGYYPARQELDVLPLFELLKNKAITTLPVTKDEKKLLVFRLFKCGDPLEKDRYGISIPEADAQTMIPDILIVPLLAFNRAGHRLGYGAGFYDTTLRALRAQKPVLAIGAGFAMQETDALETQPHDEPLDLIVTETETIIPVIVTP